MNEKTAKKVGEAYAFSETLANTFEKVPEVMKELLGDKADDIVEATVSQKQGLDSILDTDELTEMVHTKSDKTVIKIATMADTYVGDEWDNPVEVLEWMSFFLGAALIHWQLIHGSAEAMENDSMKEITSAGISYFEELLSVVRTTAQEVGAKRAGE